MRIREFVRSHVRALGYDVVKYVPEMLRPFPVLPHLVRAQLERSSSFFFVQVGANDGVRDDPIRDLVIEHKLKGLLIEPLPDMFEKMKQSYSSQPQLQFENAAVAASDGTVPIFRIAPDADVPDWYHGMASMDRQHLLRHGGTESMVEECQVQSLTLKTILGKHGIKAVDFLQVDTEGFDFEVIKFAFAAGLRPNLINFEHYHLAPKVRHECRNLLDSLGYRFIEVGKDTIAVKAENADALGPSVQR